MRLCCAALGLVVLSALAACGRGTPTAPSPGAGGTTPGAAAARLYFLDIELPSTCRTNGANNSSYYASSADAFGASTFQLTTSSTLTLRLSRTGSSVSGTIGGSASLTGNGGVGRHATIWATSQSSSPALVSGAVIHPDGTMTGLFNGYVGIYDSFGDGGSCTAVGAVWKIRPRME
jgi:hypothetical protein